ncbi:MAG: lysine--tRNA ligase [Candidatus Berkelbacteria bacterium]|nr:lysine--tRNA ligase [Candidatus Berkelbacteria bacterium]
MEKQESKAEAETETKLENLNKLKEKGVNPYPSKVKDRILINEALKKEGERVSVAGRTVSIREHGKSLFADIYDESGKIQIYLKIDLLGEEKFNGFKLIDVGDIIEASGEVFKTQAGEISIKVEDYRLLAKTLAPIPSSWYGLRDVEVRYRKRFLDYIVNEKARDNLKTRSRLISFLRRFMDENDFIEVETPILQAIPGGAAAKPFVTHCNILDHDFYLRIAPELYLKRLTVGGFEKVYEIGRAFRNEGLSHMHNPEFTIFEFYWAYVDYEFLMEFTEKMVKEAVKEIKGSLQIEYQGKKIDFEKPFGKITFRDLVMQDCGIDIDQFKDFESLKNEILAKDIKIETMNEVKVWSKLVDELYKKVSREKIIEPIFVVDHPVELTPLAKKKEDDPTKAQRFQLVTGGGLELVNAYTELNDPLDQEQRFKQQLEMKKAGWEETQDFDANFIEALKVGLPPTAGWGMGIERFVMLLTDQYSIKEVIAFPTLRPKNKEGEEA